MTRKALLVGINYTGTSHALRGCINDVNNMQTMLRSIYRFTQIETLLEKQATTKNILSSLYNMVTTAESGDHVLFHFSGHGSQVRDDNGDEADGLDEIICPIDLNWRDRIIRDDDLKKIFDLAKEGVEITVILDCCHSGDGIDQPNKYSPVTNTIRKIFKPKLSSRYLAPPAHLAVRSFSRSIKRPVENNSVLISGCRSYQTSADARINGQFCGACTYAIITTLQHNQWNMTHKDLTDDINNMLSRMGFTQRPELSGPERRLNDKFLNGSNVVTRSIVPRSLSFVEPGSILHRGLKLIEKLLSYFTK